MDIYITEIESGSGMVLSMIPEKVRFQGDVRILAYDVISLGEVKLPSGTKLPPFSWSGILPGRSRRNASYVKSQHWRSPDEILKLWERWGKNGTKLRLMITETPINYDVYLDKYSVEAVGGNGDYEYDITFIEARPMTVRTVDEGNQKSAAGSRPPAAGAKTYTVKSGDSLWKIAQSILGKGSRYMEIYNLNRDKIKDPNVIYEGQVLTMPEGGANYKEPAYVPPKKVMTYVEYQQAVAESQVPDYIMRR